MKPRRLLALGVLAAWAALVPVAARADDRARELRVLSYNVHGLPSWIAGDDPAARMPEIGRIVAGYDVALLQESWVHHDALRQAAGRPPEHLGSGPRSSWLASFGDVCGRCGSGLAVLLPGLPADAVVAHEAGRFDTCSGWLSGGNDCWASKGWIWLRVRVAPGLELDLVDTHLDAGDGPDDLAVRTLQLERLGSFVAAHSAGRALVLGGDLNLDYDDPVERALVEDFATKLGLRDSGARPRAAGARFERIDWILHRSGERVALELLAAEEAEELAPDGMPLSDHPGLRARFRVSPRPASGSADASGEGPG